MATISATDRARILMDLIKDSTVTDATPYATLDMMAGPKAIEIAQNFWDQYGQQAFDEQDPPEPRDPTNAELATFFINTLRNFVKQTRKAQRAMSAAGTAHDAEAATVDAENDTDLGTDE